MIYRYRPPNRTWSTILCQVTQHKQMKKTWQSPRGVVAYLWRPPLGDEEFADLGHQRIHNPIFVKKNDFPWTCEWSIDSCCCRRTSSTQLKPVQTQHTDLGAAQTCRRYRHMRSTWSIWNSCQVLAFKGTIRFQDVQLKAWMVHWKMNSEAS